MIVSVPRSTHAPGRLAAIYLTGSRAICIATGLVILASPAMAADPRQIGASGDWTAYALDSKSSVSCFISSSPKSRSPDGLKRDPGTLFVTNPPGGKGAPEIAVALGFPAKKGVSHTLVINGQSFTLYGQGENAWPQNDADGKTIVDLMRTGRDVRVNSTSSRGNRNSDTYSLTGFSAAWATAVGRCR